MKKLLFALLLCAGFTLPALGQSGNPPITITEVDGSPRVTNPTKIVVSNGSLTVSGKTATIVTGGGGGGGTPGGANTQVQYNNAGSFGGVAGFTFNGTAKITLGVAGSSVGAIGFNNATSGQITLQPVTGALGTVTLSLPAATDTLVGRATTDTLSNKTLASPTVTGNISAEATSRLIYGSNEYRYTNTTGPAFYDDTTGNILTFNVQSLAANRTVTFPNSSLTIAGIDVANAWADGVKQTFNPDATTAGFNVGSVAGDPSTPANGDCWYDSTANEFTCRINGANVALGAGGGSPGGSNTQLQYNNSGAFGGISGATSDGTTVTLTSPTVNTGITLNAAPLTMSGNISSAAWTTNGLRIKGVPATLTDTTSSGTVAAAYTNAYGGNTIAASSSTTFTNYYTTFMTQPTAGSNVTFTRRWALGLSGALRENIDAIGTTSTDGIVLENTTAAAAGAQQYSPRLRLTGQGWKTDATAASRTVDWIIENIPVQGTANPDTGLNFSAQLNAGGYNARVRMLTTAGTGTSTGGILNVLNPNGTNAVVTGYGRSFFGSGIVSGTASSPSIMLDGSNVIISIRRSAHIGWSNSATDASTSQDASFIAASAGVIRCANGGTGACTGFVLGTSTVGSIGTSGVGVLAIANGTAPSSSPADEFQLYSADSAAGDANAFARNEAGEVNRLTGLAARNSSSFAKTSDTTLANITGLTRNVEAGRTYYFETELSTTSANTGGVKFAISGTATATAIDYEGVLRDSTTISAATRATALDTTVCAVTAVTAATCRIRGVLVVGNAGTITVQFAQNASDGSASTVLVNQALSLRPIN